MSPFTGYTRGWAVKSITNNQSQRGWHGEEREDTDAPPLWFRSGPRSHAHTHAPPKHFAVSERNALSCRRTSLTTFNICTTTALIDPPLVSNRYSLCRRWASRCRRNPWLPPPVGTSLPEPRGVEKYIYYKVQMNESGNKIWENKNKEGYPRMGVTSHIHGALIDEFERSRRAAAAASGSTHWLTPSLRSGSMRLDLHGNTQGHASPCLVRGRVEPLCVSVCVRECACPMHGNYRRCSLITTKTLEFESKAFRGKQAAVFNERRHTSKVPNRRKDRIKWHTATVTHH